MRKLPIRFGAIALFACAVSGLVGAQYSSLQVFPLDQESVVTSEGSELAGADESPVAWFIELSGPPVADGGDLATIRQQKAAFRSAAARAGVRMTERRAFDVLWNGLSVSVPAEQVSRLRSIAGVTAIYPVLRVDPLDDAQPINDPALFTALGMTGADIAQSSLGLTGAGIAVAVMDSGIDYDHPDLGACFGEGCRVAKGYDFVGDAFDAGAPVPVIAPDDYPDDCGGHGTHVAGIVGANGLIKGVAPAVTFYAYRVFGCTGSTFSDIMLAAMERAYADGADILTMSIGSARQWPEYPTAQGSDRLVRKGIVVVAAAGNDATQGVYGSAAPGVGSKVISVASVNNTHQHLTHFVAAPGGPFGFTLATAAPPPPFSGTYPLGRTGTTTTTNDACNAVAPAPGSLAGQVVLVRRGICGFHEKAVNVQNAGAAAMILYNNAAGGLSPTVAGPVAITIPVVAISMADGATLNSHLNAGPVSITWTQDVLTIVNPGGGLIASSSSYGPSPDLTLKPDITAPGGAIRSTYPIEKGSYAVLGGTSMATPHVTGAIALLLQARPNTPPAMVRALLQNTADPFAWFGNPTLGFLDNVHRQGAGLLDVDDAILSSVKIEPSKLSLGESEFGPVTQTLTFTNDGSAEMTFSLSHTAALATTGTFASAISFWNAPASVAFSTAAVTVPAGGTATVDVTISPNASLSDGAVYGGYIVATAPAGTYRVPFAGFKGDYQAIPVLVPTTNGFPWIARQAPATPPATGVVYIKQAAGETFTLEGGNIPYVVVHLDHHVSKLRIDVKNAVTGKSWHRFIDEKYFSRNSAATSFFVFAFNGTTFSGQKAYTVPDGEYVVSVSVLKALGDDNNPAHWETWTSPMFVIDRP